MKRATTFMVEKVSTNGGYVWAYLPDLSRRWGELEARETQIWIQPPGTRDDGPSVSRRVSRDGRRVLLPGRRGVAGALIWAQHPSGGWNYLADFAGDRSLREWYDTVGRNAWRMEEFQHHWGNATFDDAGTAESAKLLLRLYVEKRDPNTSRRSTRRFSSSSTASIRLAPGRSAFRCSTSSRITAARLHVVPDLQRRRGRREHRLPRACAIRRSAIGACSMRSRAA